MNSWRRLARVAAVGWLVFTVATAEGQDNNFNGVWRVGYEDAALGPVRGVAKIVEATGEVTVILRHPRTSERIELSADSFTRNGDAVTFELRGEQPRSVRRTGRELPDVDVRIQPGTDTISVVSESNQGLEATVLPRPAIDTGVVRVILHKVGPSTLSGAWSYRADPVTGRDSRGYGRAGNRVVEDDIVYQRGWEVWHRPAMQIGGAFALDKQLQIGARYGLEGKLAGEDPAFPHPFQDNAYRGRSTKRRVFIFGENLPWSRAEVTELEPLTPGISYSRPQFPDEFAGLPNNPFEEGVQMLVGSTKDPIAHEALRQVDFMIVEATLDEGVLPGLQSLRVNGKEAVWTLQFGDNAASVSFVRAVDPDLRHNQAIEVVQVTPTKTEHRVVGSRSFEPTHAVFLPETFRLEVTTELDLGIEVLNVSLGRFSEPYKIDGKVVVEAWRTPDNPRVYRTHPIQTRVYGSEFQQPVFSPLTDNPAQARELALAGSDIGVAYIPVAENNTLTAMIAEDSLISVTPSPTSVKVLRTPSRPGTIDREISFLWKEALLTAARCNDVEMTTDWDRLNYEYIDSINSHLIYPAWWIRPSQLRADQPVANQIYDMWRAGGVLNTDLLLADHAAMILLHRAFTDLTDELIAGLFETSSDSALAAMWLNYSPLKFKWLPTPVRRDGESEEEFRLRQELVDRVNHLGHPFQTLSVDVKGPDGEPMPFWETWWHEDASDFLARPNPENMPRWILDATSEALSAYQELIVDATFEASQLDVCDPEELLKLTGNNFESVRLYLNSYLVKLEESTGVGGATQQWVADEHARFRVYQVTSKWEQVSLLEHWSERDTEELSLLASGVLSALIAPLGAAAGIATAMLDVGVTGALSYSDVMDAEAETRFAMGTVDMLGYGRASVADLNDVTVFDTVGAMAQSGLMSLGVEAVMGIAAESISGVFRIWQSGARRLRMRRGEAILREVDWNVNALPRNLDEAAVRDVAEWIQHASGRRTARRALSDVQERVLSQMDNELRAMREPEWAAQLEPQLREQLSASHGRADVTELMDSAGDRVRAALHNPETRNDALEVLLLAPVRDAEAFERMMARKAEVRAGAPQAVFDQAGETAVRRNLEMANWRMRGTIDETGVTISVRDPDGGTGIVKGALDRERGIYYVLSEPGRPAGVREVIDGPLNAEIPGRGVPVDLFSHHRILKTYQVPYTGGGIVSKVRMERLTDPESIIQLEWFRSTYYPGRSLDELMEEGLLDPMLRNLSAVQWAEDMLSKAGMEITGVRLGLRDAWEVRAAIAARENPLDAASGQLRRQVYGLDVDQTATVGFHIELDVGPKRDVGDLMEVTLVQRVDQLLPEFEARAAEAQRILEEELGVSPTSAYVFARSGTGLAGLEAEEAVALYRLNRPDLVSVERIRQITGLTDEQINRAVRRYARYRGVRGDEAIETVVRRYHNPRYDPAAVDVAGLEPGDPLRVSEEELFRGETTGSMTGEFDNPEVAQPSPDIRDQPTSIIVGEETFDDLGLGRNFEGELTGMVDDSRIIDDLAFRDADFDPNAGTRPMIRPVADDIDSNVDTPSTNRPVDDDFDPNSETRDLVPPEFSAQEGAIYEQLGFTYYPQSPIIDGVPAGAAGDGSGVYLGLNRTPTPEGGVPPRPGDVETPNRSPSVLDDDFETVDNFGTGAVNVEQPRLSAQEYVDRQRSIHQQNLAGGIAGAQMNLQSVNTWQNWLAGMNVAVRQRSADSIYQMIRFGVPRDNAINHGLLFAQRTATGGRLQHAETVMRGVIWFGHRRVSIAEFMEALDMNYLQARVALENAYSEAGLPIVKDELVPLRLMPPQPRY